MRKQITDNRRRMVEGVRGLDVKNKSFNAQFLSYLASYLLILIMTLSLTACGGDGGDSADSDKTVIFSSNAATYNVYMDHNTSLSSGNVLAIDIKVDDILAPGIYGAAFDVDFDSSKMTYSSYSTGNFLETGGSAVTYSAAPESGNSGKLVVGISRQGSTGGIAGSGTLITLRFNVTGDGSISFSNHELLDENGNIIPAIWSPGGTVSVQ